MKDMKTMVRIALCACVIVLSAWLTIPGPIPFTLQSLAILTIAGLLGSKCAVLSVVVYLLLGALGVPVFSGFRGGFQVLLGPTGGYLIGFIFTAFLVGFLSEKLKRPWAFLLGMCLGTLILYAFGTGWYAIAYGGNVNTILLTCVVPFLLPDALKMLVAFFLVRRLRRAGLKA